MAYTFKHGDRPIDGLTIQRAVGRGGFGEVYYAVTDSGKEVAVKYLRDNAEVELRGISHVINLKSPHLITIYDVRRTSQGEPLVIMEYVSGPSLRDLLIAEPQGLGPQKTAFFVKGIAAGLGYLHDRGIVHRDLKPGNIFYDDGYVKIGDYGLSKHISVSAASANTISVGTVHYMAPEIGTGSYTKSIDIYALGVMMYEMLTGRLPFTGASMGEILMRHLRDVPDVSGLPEPFAHIIARCLEKEPEKRYADVNELLDELMAADGIDAQLESFDASVLTQTPRVVPGYDPDRTVTTPPRPAPLDAREALPPLPQVPPAPEAPLRGKAAKKAAKLRKKMEKKAAKIRRAREKLERIDEGLRSGMRATFGRAAAMNGGIPGATATETGSQRWSNLWAGLLVLFGVAGGLAIRIESGPAFGVFVLYLGGASLGTLFCYRYLARGTVGDPGVYDRLAYGAAGFLGMLPAVGAAYESTPHLRGLIVVLTVVLMLFDWNQRIELGRRQIIEAGPIIWHGIVGMLVAAITETSGGITAGVMSAGLLVVVQMLAGFKPVLSGGSDAGLRGMPATPPTARPAARGEVPEAVGQAPADGEQAPLPAAEQNQREADEVRRSSSVRSWMLVLLVLLAVLAPLGMALEHRQGMTQTDSPGALAVAIGVLLPGIVWTLAMSRGRVRRAGRAHAMRGIIGSGAILAAVALMALPFHGAWRLLLDEGLQSVVNQGDALKIALPAAMLLSGFILLGWPARRNRPIVI